MLKYVGKYSRDFYVYLNNVFFFFLSAILRMIKEEFSDQLLSLMLFY